MKTELKYCPDCKRIYTDEDFCIDCAHDKDGLDSVELEILGEFQPDEIKNKMFDLNENTKEILGKPNFTCMNIAIILRASGKDIKNKSEDEQAHVIYFLLEMYEKYGKDWREKANEELKEMADSSVKNQA